MADEARSDERGSGARAAVSTLVPDPLSTAGLELSYQHLRVGLDRQHTEVERLTTRAAALLGVAGVVLTLGAAADPAADGASDLRESALLVVGFALFVAVAAYSYRGWRLQPWRWDPHPMWVWREMANEDEATIKLQAACNMAEAYEQNNVQLDRKRASIQHAIWLLILEVGYVFSVLIVLPYL